jgi:hypothetical protein
MISQGDAPYDASDAKTFQARVKETKSKDVIAREGLRQAMSNEGGRAWLHKTLMACDPFRNPFSTDALLMAHRCGEVNIGLQLIADMNEVSPELYLQMIKENK